MTKSIRQEIDALRALSVPELVERHEQLFGRRPRSRHMRQLWHRCAWKLQEQRLGGLSGAARRRLDTLMAQIELGTEPLVPPNAGRVPHPSEPLPESTLTRIWRGQEIRVEVIADGFEWNGVSYRSLSAVARAVTGAHWNGRLFFGLSKRSRKKPS